MRILEPSENISGITDIIERAKKLVVIVSPYSYLVGWDRLKNAINDAAKRGIEVNYYVREKEGLKGLEGLNVRIHEVPMLHAKMFFSESEAIISSFHLMNTPDINWAFKMESSVEYKELMDFFEKYVNV